MYPTDDQSNGRVAGIRSAPISHAANCDSAASRNAAADVIRGQLDATIPEQKSKILRQKKLSCNHFPLNCNQNPKSDQNSLRCNIQASASFNSATARAERLLIALWGRRHCPNQIQPKPPIPGSRKPNRSNSKFAVHTQVSADQWKQYTALGRNIIRWLRALLRGRYCGKNPDYVTSQNITPRSAKTNPGPTKSSHKGLRSHPAKGSRPANKVKNSAFRSSDCWIIGAISLLFFGNIPRYAPQPTQHLVQLTRKHHCWRLSTDVTVGRNLGHPKD